jgi:RHS repeat-associated protein
MEQQQGQIISASADRARSEPSSPAPMRRAWPWALTAGGLFAIACAAAASLGSTMVPTQRKSVHQASGAAQVVKTALRADDLALPAPMTAEEALASSIGSTTDDGECIDCNPFAATVDRRAAGDQAVAQRLAAPGLAAPVQQEWEYDTLGNITFNTHRGNYHYEDTAHPMRVTKVTGGGVGTNRVYEYDAVGNQTGRPGAKVVYNERNLPARLLRPDGTIATSFLYGARGERVRKTSSTGTITSIRGLYEAHRSSAGIAHRLIVPGVAILSYKQSGNVVVRQPERYVHTDHLGSTIAIISDDDPGTSLKAVVKEVRSYDAFGLTRSPDWKSGSYAGIAPAQSMQGYTGHNDDPELGLIDMKGRIYDPLLGRFLSADPLVSDPTATQPWHPYAYVRNNPLLYTDPTGFEDCIQRAFDGSCIGGGSGGYGPAVWDNVGETQRFGDARDTCSSGAGCFDDGRLEREYERKSAINDAQQRADSQRALKQAQEKSIKESGGNSQLQSGSGDGAGRSVMPGIGTGGPTRAKCSSKNACGTVYASRQVEMLDPEFDTDGDGAITDQEIAQYCATHGCADEVTMVAPLTPDEAFGDAERRLFRRESRENNPGWPERDRANRIDALRDWDHRWTDSERQDFMRNPDNMPHRNWYKPHMQEEFMQIRKEALEGGIYRPIETLIPYPHFPASPYNPEPEGSGGERSRRPIGL